MNWRGRIALGWGVMASCAVLALAGGQGFTAAEAATLAAGERAAGWLVKAPDRPQGHAEALEAMSRQHDRPLLAETLHGFADAGGRRLGLGPVRGARLGAALVAGLLAAALSVAGFALGGPAVALLAPALFWFSPRATALGPLATPDLLGALLWLLSVAAYGRALGHATRLARTRAGLSCAALAAAAAAVRPDLASAWLVIAIHWGLGRIHLRWLARRGGLAAEPPVDWEARLRRIPTAIGAGLLLIPAAVLAFWPGHWAAPLDGLRALPAAIGWGLDSPPVNPVLLALAALPAPTVALLLLGTGHAGLRLVRALRRHDGAVASAEALWLLAGTLPLLLAGVGLAPRLPGLAPLVHGLAPLSLLGARALWALAELAWPARQEALAGALAIALLYPGARAAAVTWPLGASAWGEPLGGAAGAAWRDWPRQDGGEAALGVLGDLALHSVPGARIHWIGVAPWALARYRQAGLLRPDLAEAGSLAEADLAVVARLGSRGDEYDVWTEFGNSRPVSGLFLDEVGLVLVYARPGAWR
jgi:hypothetical protein